LINSHLGSNLSGCFVFGLHGGLHCYLVAPFVAKDYSSGNQIFC
jgi:hypothetical protein